MREEEMLLRSSITVAVALVFAACGGGGGEAAPPATPATTEPSTVTPPVETKSEPVASAAPAASSAAPVASAVPAGPDSATQLAAGDKAYAAACAMCHGKKGEGKGKNPALVSAKALDDQHNGKELFDYIKMNMPPKKPGSLSDDDTWAVTAWLLDKNGLLNGKGLSAANGTSVTWKR